MAAVSTAEYVQPAVTTDTALFSVRGHELVVLTVQRDREPFAGWWALPGDYIRAEEALDGRGRTRPRPAAGRTAAGQ